MLGPLSWAKPLPTVFNFYSPKALKYFINVSLLFREVKTVQSLEIKLILKLRVLMNYFFSLITHNKNQKDLKPSTKSHPIFWKSL